MSQWLGGLLEHAPALSLIGSPLPNGYTRVRPYTFAPTHVLWGLDNRSVLCRCTVGAGNANRIEFRSPGSDANPYLMIAAILAAGCDGVERGLVPGDRADGDKYDDPGDAEALPAAVDDGIAAFEGSALAAQLGEKFSHNFVLMAQAEAAKHAEAGGDPSDDEVTDWERERYLWFA